MIAIKSILLVEDNPNDAELTLTALQENNLANGVVWVKDGVEALDYLYRRGAYDGRTSGNPVLVMLDLKLPRVDGKEVLKTLKGDPALRKIPVVVLTSSQEESDLCESYDLGVNAYVVKPVGFDEFLVAVKVLGSFWALLNEAPPGSREQG
jgi:CheY-like chemotaxis protein